ncbi:hypothetical protein [Planomonospora sp. ID82291]|uniref:hypothetical protein n=1 Tax=Planomonospora sp. ID82291 TaxID=2738136 RepID=UPI0018C3DEC9|nr:hypothetical protein [Planomonospora sp. ID82291]MBG0818970.1 hypothetical protein [Planomonospora sp. ID82291]
MYFDPNELIAERDREQHDPAAHAQQRRVVRDLVGLALLLLGALCTSAAAYLWSPAAGLALVGVYLMAGGWLLASGQAS